MSVELKMLVFSAVLGVVQLMIAATFSVVKRGLPWNLGPRDEKKPDLTGIAGRFDRAFYNFLETFVFFAVAVLVCAEMKVSNSMTMAGAQIYFFARLIYVPVYAVGLPVLRTLIWTASVVGIVMVLVAAL